MSGWTMLTIIGEDRPGIVAAVTKILYEKGMNLGEASMLRLGGAFTIMLMVQGAASADDVARIVQPVAEPMGLRVHADPIEGKLHDHVEPNARITIFGADRAGIVAKATGALAEAGYNISLLETDVGGSQVEPIYIMQMEGVASRGIQSLKDSLAGLAREGVEISVEPIDTMIG
ncbi:MAG: amino acid-binding protein [Nitrospinota bacterium]|nr:amino acid-binding protein [Nitrospinota bacterium]MDH5755302.1 amino acid-binding protein [Nitrospinota bacterium]